MAQDPLVALLGALLIPKPDIVDIIDTCRKTFAFIHDLPEKELGLMIEGFEGAMRDYKKALIDQGKKPELPGGEEFLDYLRFVRSKKNEVAL